METITTANGAVLFKNLHDEDVAVEMSKLFPACMAYIDCMIFFASRYEGRGSIKINLDTASTLVSGKAFSKEILSLLTIKITDALCVAGYRIVQTGFIIEIIWMRPADNGC